MEVFDTKKQRAWKQHVLIWDGKWTQGSTLINPTVEKKHVRGILCFVMSPVIAGGSCHVIVCILVHVRDWGKTGRKVWVRTGVWRGEVSFWGRGGSDFLMPIIVLNWKATKPEEKAAVLGTERWCWMKSRILTRGPVGDGIGKADFWSLRATETE